MELLIVGLLVVILLAILAAGGYLVVLLRRMAQAGASAVIEQRFAKQEESDERRATLLAGRFEDALRASGQGTQDSLRRALDELRASVNSDLGAGRKESSETLDRTTKALEERVERLRQSNEQRLRELQEDNSRKLDQMRAVVDERLQKTLETRLGESFKQVSDRLEQVHKGLGEMQTLAGEVGGLKKVLANVKTRGTWGEVQLGNLLEEVLAPEQFERNVETKPGSGQRVEFAIRLPGRGEGEAVWLPIDAKFPREDYERLLAAQDQADAAGAESAAKQLEARVKGFAWDIHDKYLNPPQTTDFGIMFLPTEGLYAEVLRRPGLADALQRESRVVVAGPTTLWAVLNSLQMGFRTLAIEQRSSEVWKLLGAVKAEFGKFGDVLDKVHKQLQTASNTVEDASRKTRTIGRKLRQVEALPTDEAGRMLELESGAAEPEADAEET